MPTGDDEGTAVEAGVRMVSNLTLGRVSAYVYMIETGLVVIL